MNKISILLLSFVLITVLPQCGNKKKKVQQPVEQTQEEVVTKKTTAHKEIGWQEED